MPWSREMVAHDRIRLTPGLVTLTLTLSGQALDRLELQLEAAVGDQAWAAPSEATAARAIAVRGSGLVLGGGQVGDESADRHGERRAGRGHHVDLPGSVDQVGDHLGGGVADTDGDRGVPLALGR